jgi:hypothetical protein
MRAQRYVRHNTPAQSAAPRRAVLRVVSRPCGRGGGEERTVYRRLVLFFIV